MSFKLDKENSMFILQGTPKIEDIGEILVQIIGEDNWMIRELHVNVKKSDQINNEKKLMEK